MNSISTAISASDCSNIAGGMSPCYMKRSKLDPNGNITERSGNMKKPRFSSYGAALPAVPLRSTPPEKGKRDPQKIDRSHRKDDGFQTNLANTRKTECSRERDSKKLAAGESISLVDGKHSTCKDIQAVGKENGFGMGTSTRVLSSKELNKLLIRKGNGAKGSNGKYRKMVGEEPDFVDSKAKYFENQGRLIGRNEQAQRFKVLESLKVFEKEYNKLVKERELDVRRGKITKRMLPHVEAAARVKKMGKSASVEMGFGHIPGIEIGDKFRFRVELAMVGLHRLLIPGIDYVNVKGKKYATSVVDSGRYENKAKGPGVLIYTGQGGNPKITENVADQKLERGNLALVNSMEMGFPVRVIYKRKNLMASKPLDTRNEGEFVYVYDGLYTINDYWQERQAEQGGKLVYKFELRRLSDQLKSRKPNVRLGKVVNHDGACVLDDVSQGKEKVPIHVVNGKDDDLPQPFTYVTKIIYHNWFQQIKPVGCGCTNGCSDSHQCACVLKNGGEIPFNEVGAILRARPRVYECGPSCKCPPNCMNRVTQHGPRHQLEIFKTESRGWGVRSPSFISSGSFICEYVGELLRDKEAEERGANNDEYLFDICNSDGEIRQGKSEEQGFALDAAVYGNIGRFINHSCSSVNLYAQEVFYDHDDKRMPHIMFFAKKDIPQYQELTYHYNYKIGRVCDANGNTKVKNCYCGSRKCTGRMY